MNDVLMQIAIESAAFFALSDDDMVDQDTAVRQLEFIAASLHQLNDVDRTALLRYIEELAACEAAETGSTPRVAFLKSFGDSMGLY